MSCLARERTSAVVENVRHTLDTMSRALLRSSNPGLGCGMIVLGLGKTGMRGRNGSGQVVQGAAVHHRGDLWAVRWYLMFPISYRDLELMLLDRGLEADHTTIFRGIQAYAAELEKRIRPYLRTSNGSWRVDETYVRVKGRWTYLYRAVDSRGQTIDFLLSARRDAAAAMRRQYLHLRSKRLNLRPQRQESGHLSRRAIGD